MANDPPPITVTFGSANNQNNAQTLWSHVLDQRPTAWVWGGDAIRPADFTQDAIRTAFQTQRASGEYQALVRQTRILGTWNVLDSAFTADVKTRAAARDLFLDVVGEPRLSPRRKRQGIYSFTDLGTEPFTVRVILLDVRYLGVQPGRDADLLGTEQWGWLEGALASSKAVFNLIVSPIPVVPTEIPVEKWSDFGASRERLFRLISSTGASGVVLLTGGRLVGEMSQVRERIIGYPLVELTASGLTTSDFRYSYDTNKYRWGEVFVGLHFGVARAEWGKGNPSLRLLLVDRMGGNALERWLSRSTLSGRLFESSYRGIHEPSED
ncbi:MAG: alkaline phosphatase D family protein [Verrucomicrobiia bacterium]